MHWRVRGFAAALLIGCSACSGEAGTAPKRVRPSALAGGWYPADRAVLARTVSGFLSRAKKSGEKGRLWGLIVPHAGYQYSGRVAGWGFKQVERGRCDRVVILAPTHRGRFRGFSIMDVDAYRTPLGEVRLDAGVCAKLRKHALHEKAEHFHRREHAIEIELPFLQQVAGKFRLVPILIGALGPQDAARIAKAVSEHLTQRTLVVASSDFTHYGPNFGYVPFQDNVEDNLRKLDMGAVERILAKDCDAFTRYVNKTGATICGRNGIAILLKMLPGEARATMLKRDTSGRMTGDFRNSVSYVSIEFRVGGKGAPARKDAERKTQGPLSVEEKRTLLRIARDTVEGKVRTGRAPEVSEETYKLTPRLKARAGAFVTLKKRGELRGCIGRIGYPEVAAELPPLYEAVALMAVESCMRDYRFQPVRPEELKDIRIEVSALTIAEKISGPEEFAVGKHGIILRKGLHGAMYLPQIAPERGWDRAQTLSSLCRKARLPADEWRRPGMRFFVFTAQVFDESLLRKAAE